MSESGRRWSRWWKTGAVLLLVAGAAWALRVTLFRAAPVAVTVCRVETGRVEDTVVNSRAGTVQSRRRAGMSPGIPGLVVEVLVKDGSRVRAGDTLLRLEDTEHRAQVELAQRALEAARAGAEQARLEADLSKRLWTKTESLAQGDVVSDTVVEQDRTRALTTESARVAAAARVMEAEAALAVARATLDKTVMKAPFEGVVLEVTTELGEWISPAPPGVFIPPVIDLIDPQALYVSAPIDEADVARLRVGLPVRIALDAFRGKSFNGTLSYVSSFVQTREDQNRTLRVEANLAETVLPPNLLAGLSADIEVILDAREGVVRVPTYALLEGGRVLTVVGDRLVERPVVTGLRNWSFTEIASGLAAGERVVVSLDRPEVVAGARVKVTGEVTP